MNLKKISTAISEAIGLIPTTRAETLVDAFCKAESNLNRLSAKHLISELSEAQFEGPSAVYDALDASIHEVARYLARIKREAEAANPKGFTLQDRAHFKDARHV
jgi:hypothetical protein